MKTYWGIDLGGTKIEGVVLQTQTGLAPTLADVVIRKRIDTEALKGYGHILARVRQLVEQLKAETGLVPEHIGFATPGTFDHDRQVMKNCNTTCLNGQNMPADLAYTLQVPVSVANDANCFALAEATLGIVPDVLPDFRVVFGVIMGTGVGGGVVMRGHDGRAMVIGGRHGIGGEWGHNVLEESGLPCYCGKSGCVEQVISGPALQQYYQRIGGTAATFQEIINRYEQGGDVFAEKTVNRLLDQFGKAISVIINILDPDAIVLGGGLGNIDLLYTEGVNRIRPHIFNSGEVRTPFLKPKLGDSAGVFGAAML